MKKKYKIILIVTAIIVVVALVVFVWLKPGESEKPDTPPDNEVNLPDGSLDENEKLEEEKFSLTRLSDEDVKVFDFWGNKESGEIYYITTRGEIKIAKMGADSEISTRKLSAINNVRPDIEGNRVLISFGDPKNPDWGLFDSSDEVWRPLPSYIKDVVWGSEEDEVISIANTEGGKSLVSFDIEELRNGEGQVKEFLIRNFSFKDVEIVFSPPSSVIIMEKPASFYGSRVWRFNINDKSLAQILTATKGLVMDWTEDNLVFEYKGTSNRFNILDKDLNNVFPVPFTTLPSKCSVREEIAYCFVPINPLTDLESDINLPEDYFKNKFYTSDSLYKLDLALEELGQVMGMNEFKTNIDAYLPQQIGESIYFINKYNKALYQLTIRD